MDLRPHLLLGEIKQAGEHNQEDHDLEADALALPPGAARPPTSGMPPRPWHIGRPSAGSRRCSRPASLSAAAAWRARGRGNICCSGRPPAAVKPSGGFLEAGQIARDVVGALLLKLREHVEHEPREAALVAARLGQRRQVRRRDAMHRLGSELIRERRREIVGQPARRVLSARPLSSGSLILTSAATAAACASEKPGPPGSARLRKATICSEWQTEQTSL